MWFFIGWAKRFHFLRRNGHVKPCWPRRISPVPTQARTCTFLSCPLLSTPSHWNTPLVSWNEISSHSLSQFHCLAIFNTISRKKSSVIYFYSRKVCYIISRLALAAALSASISPAKEKEQRERATARPVRTHVKWEVLSTFRPPWRILHYNQGIMTVIESLA